MLKLRDYQQQASDSAVRFFQTKGKGNGLIVLPTGSGKSLVIADIASRLGQPVVIFQPSKEILEQNYNKMLTYQPYGVGIYSASFSRKEIFPITFATIGSVVNHKNQFTGFRYAIIDECHLVNAEDGMYHDFIMQMGCKVVGLTATPYRLYSNRMYGSMLRFITRTRPHIFTHLLYHVQVGSLLERGYLANLNYYQLNVVNTARLRVNSTGADFTDASLRQHYQEIRFNDTLENIINRLLVAGRKSILVFTRFTDEAEALAKQLGTHAAVVSAQTPAKERAATLQAFKAGRIKVVTNVVTNVGVLTTGFDFPELATVVLARPTMSLALYYQMVGRAIRPYPNKVGWVVDLCGNYRRFGRVDTLEIRDGGNGKWAIWNGHKQLTNVYFSK